MNESLTILVTAIGGGGYGEQILKAVKLAQTPYKIVGTDVNPYCPQFRLVDHAMTLPGADDPGYIDAVLAVCRRFDVRVVFPGCEPELREISAARQRFIDQNILLVIGPEHVIRICMDKLATAVALKEHGFSPPRSALVRSREELATIDTYPVIVKPHIGSGGSKDCYIAQTPRELVLLAEYVGMEKGLFVQEYVGTPEDEYSVGVLLSLDGSLLNSIAVRRTLKSQLSVRISTANRTNRADLGTRLVISSGISQGEVGQFPEVTETCERVALALGATGAINIQCRLAGDQVKIFEINPRFSGTTSIRAMMGYNEPDVLMRHHLLGERIEPHFAYNSGNVMRSLAETMLPITSAPSWRNAIG